MAATGVLPAGTALEVAARTLKEQVPPPAAGGATAAAYTDGSLFDGADPVLARVGWAAVLFDAQGRALQVQSVGVEGPQTAPRAELQAMLWVVDGYVGAAPVVTDCEHISNGAAVLAADPGTAMAAVLLEGPDGGL